MAKKMKKLMAMFLAVCVMSSSFAVTAFAADEEEIKTEQMIEGGLVTDITTTTETTTDENGNKTVTVTVEKTTNGIDSEGAKIKNEQTTVTSETTTEDGVVLESSVTDEGSEKSEQIVPSDNEVTVEVFEDGKPVEDASGSDNSASVVVSGDQKVGENDSEYDQTIVTTTDRTVEVKVEDVTVSTGTPIYIDKNGNLVGDIDEGFHYYWSDVYNIDGKSFVEGEAGTAKQVVVGSIYGYIVNPDGTRKTVHTDGVIQRVVSSENGTPEDRSDDYKVGGLYCVDSSTGVTEHMEYRKANLEDSDYYTAEEAAHLRAIMTYGYTWDDDDDMGYTNLANIKAMLKEAQENGDEATKELLKDMDIDNLTRQQAATATGMAIWQFGNRFELEEGQYVEFVSRDSNAANKARIETLYKYLLTLTEEAPEDETQIINEEKFIDELDMTVGGMVDGAEANADSDNSNDVYNVELKFSLVVQPDANGDDLIVKVIDDEGNVVKTARIAGEQKEGESFGYAKSTTDENGKTYYILEDLQLAENSNTSFNLKLEGSQMLKEGVYIFESQHLSNEENVDQYIEYFKECGVLEDMIQKYGNGTLEGLKEDIRKNYTKDHYNAQNFIGKFAGTAEVDVSMQIELSFNVDESVVTTEHIWRSEGSEEAPAGNGGVFALAVHRPLENIPEEEVPLADAPQTGDEAIVFAALTLLAGMSLMAMHVSEQKRKEEV